MKYNRPQRAVLLAFLSLLQTVASSEHSICATYSVDHTRDLDLATGPSDQPLVNNCDECPDIGYLLCQYESDDNGTVFIHGCRNTIPEQVVIDNNSNETSNHKQICQFSEDDVRRPTLAAPTRSVERAGAVELSTNFTSDEYNYLFEFSGGAPIIHWFVDNKQVNCTGSKCLARPEGSVQVHFTVTVIARQLAVNGSHIRIAATNYTLSSFNTLVVVNSSLWSTVTEGHSQITLIVAFSCLLILFLLAVFYWLKRTKKWPFERNARYFKAYRYSPTRDVTVPIVEKVRTPDVYLDENCEEIMTYREQLGRCTMILPARLSIHDCIGQSHFGPIHKAEISRRTDGEAVTVTCVKSPYQMGADDMRLFLERFEKTVTASRHDNIQSLIGVCDQDLRLLICTELLEGPSLQMLLRESRTDATDMNTMCLLKADQLLKYMIGVTRGVIHLDTCKVIHTHLAAVHVTIHENVPKISDFGFSKTSDLYHRETDQRHSIVRWLAPECVSADNLPQAPTRASMVWSLGVLLWEVASLGGTPYAHVPSALQLAHLLREGHTHLAQLTHVCNELQEVIKACCTVTVSKRVHCLQVLAKLTALTQTPVNMVINLSRSPSEPAPFAPILPHLEETNSFERQLFGT